MSVARSSLRSFLASAKSTLQNAIIHQQRITLIIGNESADLDSITSAIVLAYLKSNSTPTPLVNQSVNKQSDSSQSPSFYIPLLNIPRADIKIRPELLTLLPQANLEPSHLITLDDLSVQPPVGPNPAGKEELQPKLTQLVLVDHNKLAGPLADKGFSERVVGCIDHHKDENVIPKDTSDEPRVIEKCGSCTSLVIQYGRSAWDLLSGSASNASYAVAGQNDAVVGSDDAAVRRTWDAQVAKLAIASILIDTNNLKDSSKTEEVDRQAVEYLIAKIALAPGPTGINWDQNAFFTDIKESKQDLSKLNTEEILRKDYKQWEVKDKKLGISSVVKTLSWQAANAGGVDKFKKDMKEYVMQRSLSFFAIMTTSNTEDGTFQRELLLASTNSGGNSLVKRFVEEAKDDLKLEPWEEEDGLEDGNDEDGITKVWWQRDTKSSRKQVAPLMRKIFGES